AISQPGFTTAGWLPVTVPSTAFNAAVVNHVVPDPDYGMNLRQAPGVDYKIGVNFTHDEIPADSPYAVPWWFRTEFTLPAADHGKVIWLDFHGINYRANIWLNGHEIANQKQARGTFRRFEFNVTGIAHAGRNALAVEVYAPRERDLAITFVDWNPMPPDKDMGLWQKVVVRSSGPVAIRHAWVRTKLDLPSLAVAHLIVAATLVNATDAEQHGTLQGSAAGHTFRRALTLAPHARQIVSIPVAIHHPALWWPNGMGKPALHALQLVFTVDGAVSDRSVQQFGMDEITAAKNAQGSEQFTINGRKVFVRGGGWTPDMLLRDGPAKWTADFKYARLLGLNTIRLEGKLSDDTFFNLADRYGILIMAGWCCCDHWEEWPRWKNDEGKISTASLHDQIQRLRGHASVLVWLNGSDNPPPAHVEQAYLNVEHALDWPKPILSSASGKRAQFSGASGVKMTGPYSYVPPVYWLAEPEHGGARGFNTETSPGAAIPPIASLKRFIPADHLWTAAGPNDPYWLFHAGSGNFTNLNRYLKPLVARYGAPTSLQDFVWKSAATSYAGERAMFEAFGRKQGEATGVIQWMLDNGWPSLIWHLYDYYLRPSAGFYGVERANEPLHIQYSKFDRAISFVNHTLAPSPSLNASAIVANLQGKTIYTHSMAAQTGPQSSTDLWTLPHFAGTVFLELRLRTARGKLISRNFYWLSNKPDTLNVKAGTWFYTPESQYANFTALAHLPPARVSARAVFHGASAIVHLHNSGPGVALLVHLKIVNDKTGHELLPVWWQDNYVSLLPGETAAIAVKFPAQQLHGARPALRIEGWNVAKQAAAVN
ncbi:MAG: glycosyl hydrolase 2 galactose-binding domain-containing protein, partial [Terriglobales bacterium]